MSLPNANISFRNGQLQQSTSSNTDSVFAVIGACSNAVPNAVTTIVDSATIPALLGYGPAAELAAQILSNASTTVYVVAGAKTAGSIGSVHKSRTDAPALVATSLFGLPGTPWAADYANAGNGQIFFDASTTILLSSSAATGSVTITTAGGLGTAAADVVIGGTTVSNVSLTTTPITVGSTGVVLNAVLPLGGTFHVGDVFNAVATANDNASVVAEVLNVNEQGQAQWEYSLDGGASFSSPLSANLGAVTSSGDTTPVLTLTGSAPAASHVSAITFTAPGTAAGVAAQCSVSSGLMTNNNASSGGSLATSTISGITGGITPISVASSVTLSITVGGVADGSHAKGTLSIGGTAVFTNTFLNSTYTDTTSGISFAFNSGGGAFDALDVYSITVQPVAQYKVTLDGAIGSATPLATNGVVALGYSGPTVTLAHTNTDIYTYSSTNPASSTAYSLYLYPAYNFRPKERNGQPFGLNFAFGWGLYEAGDSYSFTVGGPSVGNSDVLNALDAAQTTSGVAFSLVAVDSNPASFAVAGSLASSINADLLSQAQAPTWVFQSAVVCGPALPSSGAGSTSGSSTSAFIAATGSLDLERVALSCGADYIVSPLTGQTDLRNAGIGHIARLAADPVQQDPGAVSDGALSNVTSTTTPLADATVFNSNRGMVSTTYHGLVGVYCAEGLTLAAPGSDYYSIENRRVIDKAAKFGRAALLPYVNTTVNTVPGKGTLSPQSAAQINANVQGQIQSNCTGNFQSVSVSASTTTNILSNGGVEPVTISILPFGYFRQINASIGFTI
jgi:hypothetical protein